MLNTYVLLYNVQILNKKYARYARRKLRILIPVWKKRQVTTTTDGNMPALHEKKCSLIPAIIRPSKRQLWKDAKSKVVVNINGCDGRLVAKISINKNSGEFGAES